MDMRTCYCPAALCPRLTTSDGWGDVVGSRSANIIQLLSRSISDSEFYPNSHIHIPILLVVKKKKKRRGEGGKCCKVFFHNAFFFRALARTAPRVIGPLGTRGERRRKITSIRLIPVPFASSCVISLLYSALVKRGWFSSVPPFDSLIEGGET